MRLNSLDPRFGMAVLQPTFPAGATPREQMRAIQHFSNVVVPKRYRRETKNPFKKLARWWRPEIAMAIPATRQAQDRLTQRERDRAVVQPLEIDFSQVLLIYGKDDKALATRVELLRGPNAPVEATVLAEAEAELQRRIQAIALPLAPEPRKKRR